MQNVKVNCGIDSNALTFHGMKYVEETPELVEGGPGLSSRS
jgi:hypothetical protein